MAYDDDGLPLHASSNFKSRQRSPAPVHDSNDSSDQNGGITTNFNRSSSSRLRYWRWWCFPPRHRRRRLTLALKLIIFSALLFLCYGFYLYEPHIELAFYSRKWAAKEIIPVGPLSRCFDKDRVSPAYNVSSAIYGPKRTEVQAGIRMRFGMDCYMFAGTIKETPRAERPVLGTPGTVWEEDGRLLFHTYWRADLRKFGVRQEALLKSFFATQDPERTKLVLWSNGDLTGEGDDDVLTVYKKRFPEQLELRVVDTARLASGTELEGSELLKLEDKRGWVDGDLVRLLLLWNYGGVWVDMDSLLTRDLEPLLEHEFVTQWDCYDKKYTTLNGALMRFRKHSPYLCEAFSVMTSSSPPRSGSTDWGSILYLKLWRRLVAGDIPPFKILPFCFNDGRSCRIDNRLPDPFVPDPKSGMWTMGLERDEGGGLDQILHKVFAVHLHNQWEKPFPPNGWVQRLLLRRFDAFLEKRI
ncbi:glycosyltransferase family 32 protein [Amanita muscaria]